MKKYTLLLIVFITLQLNAQQLLRNLVISSVNRQSFIVSLDGNLINKTPLPQVAITGLDKNYYHLVVALNNSKIEKDIYVPPLSEITYIIQNGYLAIGDLQPIQNNINLPNTFSFGSILNNQGNNGNNGIINININNNVNTQASNTTNQVPDVVYVPGYNGEVGCQPPLSVDRFRTMLTTIENQNFENAKARVAKQIIDSNCMTTENIVAILNLFDFDKTKLEIAKYAYDYVYDIENYYLVNNVFDFDSNVKKLDEYIRSK